MMKQVKMNNQPSCKKALTENAGVLTIKRGNENEYYQ